MRQDESDALAEYQVARLMDSYLKRQQWLARVQAAEIAKLFSGAGDEPARANATPPGVPARAANGARYVSPSAMLKTLGVKL